MLRAERRPATYCRVRHERNRMAAPHDILTTDWLQFTY
jgi:hypothetical protein